MKVHAASGSDPGTEVVTLNGSDPDAAGLHTFTCSGADCCALSASTKYFVVMSTADTSGGVVPKHYRWKTTASEAEAVHPTGTAGWGIADVGRYKSGSNAWAALGSEPHRPAARSVGRLGVWLRERGCVSA